MRGLKLKLPKEFNIYVASAKEHAAISMFLLTKEDLPLYIDEIKQWGKCGTNEQIKFGIRDIENPT